MSTDSQPRRYYPGAAILVSMAIACVLSLSLVAGLLLGWDHFTTPGYRTIDSGGNSIAAAGMEIWDVGRFLFQLAVVAWLTTVILLVYRRLRRPPSLRRAALLGLAITVVAVMFSPAWQDLQIRAYGGPGQVTRVEIGYPVFPLFSYSTHTNRDTDYNSGQVYLCVEQRQWKIASLIIEKSFYPILDEQNAHRLLEQRCQRLVD